ncbi:unnamed protein product [Rhizoctonia solani]|uniref:CBM1 domain-containing protein n=1 Tax=Rhizoctonia solani TaxID=456999 RepID=A0A8H2Y218_9AGAM|nr:unnamed protein product [Rhizoctonia solani]
MKLALLTLAAIGSVAAQQTVPPWGTCGGIGWTGGTVCAEGWYCHEWNPWDSTCQPNPKTTVDPTPIATPA